MELSRGQVMQCMVASLVVSLAINIGLPLMYLTYLRRLEDQHCQCAVTHDLFQTLRWLVIAQLAFTVILPFVTIVPRELRVGASAALGIANALILLTWTRAMNDLKCLCSDGWQKNVWAAMSALYLSFVALTVIMLVLTNV